MSTRAVTCANCREVGRHYARGLCPTCYNRIRKDRGLHEFMPVRVVPQVDRFDWVVVDRLLSGKSAVVHPSERAATARELVRRGLSRYNAAELCGMSGKTLRQAVPA